MKKIFLLLLICGCGQAFGQSVVDIGKIPLAVEMPDTIAGLETTHVSKLANKVSQIITASGLSAAAYTPNFIVVPKLIINENNVVEGGMQSIRVITAEFTLFIRQRDKNILVASMSKTLKGSGTSYNAAISNAIGNINPNDADYKTFIQSTKDKIIGYYNSNCDNLINLAENEVIKQDYLEAISILMTVPVEATACFKNAQRIADDVYKVYQNKTCSVTMQQAKAKIASASYNDALDLLSQVDPSSPCSGEANQLIQNTEMQVSEQARKQWELALTIYKDSVALEHHRIDAIKEIAVAQYRRKSRVRKVYN